MDFEKLFFELFAIVRDARAAQKAFYGERGPERWKHQQEAMKKERELDAFIERYESGQGRLFE